MASGHWNFTPLMLPRPPNGNNPIGRWLAQLREYVISISPADSKDVTYYRTPNGTSAIVRRQGGGGGSGGGQIQRFVILSVDDNWCVCRMVDETGAQISTTNYKVMRPYKLRKDQDLYPGGNSASLLYSGNQSRSYTITIGAITRRSSEVIRPVYAVNDFIFASNQITGGTADDGTGAQLEWIDLNIDARKWQFTLSRVDLCINNTTITPAFGVISSTSAT